ncbi:hypothetical protein PYS58_13005 [Chryseobacterium indologenes]|uniref:hypothetical protein n=1 Tax=Chryseobacterium indologenes TaxID=253 RepID=UPI0023E7C83D|nr:hypothetical protein [Chryseobacterium indologenes]MDM1554359.1 hypothetical protein [Chryseobacterium indologenes]WET47505.1 hypothetical protein PYS58_13005 [Chryseobacterium indologenes]
MKKKSFKDRKKDRNIILSDIQFIGNFNNKLKTINQFDRIDVKYLYLFYYT